MYSFGQCFYILVDFLLNNILRVTDFVLSDNSTLSQNCIWHWGEIEQMDSLGLFGPVFGQFLANFGQIETVWVHLGLFGTIWETIIYMISYLI